MQIGTAGRDLKRSGQTPTVREEWNHVMNVNVQSTGVFTDAMLPLLQQSKLPKIIFLSSSLGSISRLENGGPQYSLPYAASKSAINMMTMWYSKKYRNFKINAVCPGLRATALNGAPLNEETDPALGATKVVILVNEGPNGATGTYSRDDEPLPW